MIETGVTHSAIMAWRDEATLTAMVLMHDAAAAAMQVWNEWPNDNTVPHTIGAFMTGWTVRASMRQIVGESIYKWANTHRDIMATIDHRLKEISNTLQYIDTLAPIPSNEEPKHEDLPGFKWSAATLLVGFTPLRWVPNARNRVFEASRRACLVELRRSWLSPLSGSEPHSYLAKLLNIIDRTAQDAKEIVK